MYIINNIKRNEIKMTLKEIVTTAAGCVIIAVTVVLAIQAGEIFESIFKTVAETQQTIDGINNKRTEIYDTINNARAFTSHLPGTGG